MDEPVASTPRRLLAAVALFILFAGDALRYSLSWWGYGAVTLAVAVAVLVVLARGGLRWRRIPASLVAIHIVMIGSVAWSHYPGATLLGAILTAITSATALFLAIGLDWRELIRLVRGVLGVILVGSLLFELVVATVVRAPLLPLWVDYSHLDDIPGAFYWSRALLFDGGRIQGIVGNANLLGMLALVGLIVFLAAFASRLGARGANLAGTGIALLCLSLSGSTTVLVAVATTAFVVVAAALIARTQGRARVALHLAAMTIAAGAVAVAVREPLLSLVGRSPDLTNRLTIWETVSQLAGERPVAGWGWVGYWNPFVDPFDDLLVFDGVTYLQAHSAWLDVYFQLGALGLIALAVLVIGTAVRLWLGAIEAGRPVIDGLLPLALLAALLAQSLAESRLLVEWGWAFLVILALRSTDRLPPPQDRVSPATEQRAGR